MASFKELKEKLSGKGFKSPKPKTISEDKPKISKEFEYEEARYLLSLIAKNDFRGQDVQIVYNIVLKLQTLIKENLEKEENGPD